MFSKEHKSFPSACFGIFKRTIFWTNVSIHFTYTAQPISRSTKQPHWEQKKDTVLFFFVFSVCHTWEHHKSLFQRLSSTAVLFSSYTVCDPINLSLRKKYVKGSRKVFEDPSLKMHVDSHKKSVCQTVLLTKMCQV